MKKGNFKKAFTLVELLVVVVILAILSGAAYVGIQRSQMRVMNEKVVGDLIAIENALEQFKEDHNGQYPNFNNNIDFELNLGEDKNINCFNADTSYAHDCTSAAFIQTQVDNKLMTKRYLQEVPTDPRTGARYVYGVTQDGKSYQVAGLIENSDGGYVARVNGNLDFSYPLSSLIRAFNGPNFVIDDEGYLPYSPDYMSITASVEQKVGNVTVDVDGEIKEAKNGDKLKPGSVIETVAGTVTIYFSDGSVTYLDENSKLEILDTSDVEKNDKDGIITKIRLKLFQGKIWNKVARLAEKSEFNVETTSAIAGVRGTEFGIEAPETLIVKSGSVVARRMTSAELTDGVDSTLNFADSFKVSSDIGKYRKFNVESEADAPTHLGSDSDIAPHDFITEAYKTPYNNNIKPRILSVDGMTVVFKFVEGVDKIEAFGVTDEYGWIGADIVSDIDTISLNNATALMGMTSIQFGFVDAKGNRTGLSEPAIDINTDTQLTEVDIYNDVFADIDTTSTQPGNGLVITGDSSVDLNGNPIILTSTVDCDWTLDGGGALTGITTNVSSVVYSPIDPILTMPQDLMVDITGRTFDVNNNEREVITCMDPTNNNNTGEHTIEVAYVPYASSIESGYIYSYTASNNTSWTDAGIACANLTEGGFNNWLLPSRGIYQGIVDLSTEVSKLCDFGGTSSCISGLLQGVNTFFLVEEDIPNDRGWNLSTAFGIDNINFGTTAKNDTNAFNGYRCVSRP